MKKLVLTKDLIIPAGTAFECIDGDKREYVEGNYEHTFNFGVNDVASMIVTEDVLSDTDDFVLVSIVERSVDPITKRGYALCIINDKQQEINVTGVTLEEFTDTFIHNALFRYLKHNTVGDERKG